jgi:glutathione S-transferase
MGDRPRHYGWECSPYSAKTRAYLRYKGVDFHDVHPGMWTLQTKITRSVGRLVMPTMELSDGTWLQDTSEIIDTFEERADGPSVVPTTPRQRFIAYLLELFGDEWLVIVAMHTRWNDPQNREFVYDDFGREATPWLPGPLRRRIGRTIGARMWSYLPKLGVAPETEAGIDRMLDALLVALNQHLTQTPYLLGGRPCIGDYSVMGMLYAHVLRDPGSSHRIRAHPEVEAWIDRVYSGTEVTGEWFADDQVPDSLVPVLDPVFRDALPYVRALVDAINAWCSANPDASRLPRSLGDTLFTIGGIQGQRRLITFTQWMAQRPLLTLRDMPRDEQNDVLTWLESLGHRALVEGISIDNPVERHDFRERLVSRS